MSVRYALLIEIELVWQSLGAEAGGTLYSISLGPGEEVKVAVSDGRWRKSLDARERPLQIVAKMVGARQIGDGMDAMPLDGCVAADLPSAAAGTRSVATCWTADSAPTSTWCSARTPCRPRRSSGCMRTSPPTFLITLPPSSPPVIRRNGSLRSPSCAIRAVTP